jgi:hypothetical protein
VIVKQGDSYLIKITSRVIEIALCVLPHDSFPHKMVFLDFLLLFRANIFLHKTPASPWKMHPYERDKETIL